MNSIRFFASCACESLPNFEFLHPNATLLNTRKRVQDWLDDPCSHHFDALVFSAAYLIFQTRSFQCSVFHCKPHWNIQGDLIMIEHLAMDDVLAGHIFLSLLFRILFEIYVCNIIATQHFGCQFQHLFFLCQIVCHFIKLL